MMKAVCVCVLEIKGIKKLMDRWMDEERRKMRNEKRGFVVTIQVLFEV